MTLAEQQIYIETDPFNADEPLIRAIVAAGGPDKPPKDWFTPPSMIRPTPLQVLPNGRVYGHIAPWTARHTGLPGNVRPPRSRSGYQFFHTGTLDTAEGEPVNVGQLTFAGGHAPITADADRAVQHYDDTGSSWADVRAGEDKHGIWVAGAVRPDVSDKQLRVIRAAAPSGDWRPINGSHELIAVMQVNSPGFPVPRAEALVAGGQLQAIVAAGAQDMFAIRMLDAFLPYADEALVAAIDARVDDALKRRELRARMRRS